MKKTKKYDDVEIPFMGIFSKIYKLLEYAYWKNRYDTYRKKFSIHPNFHLNGKGININGDGKLIIKGKGQMCYNTFIELDNGAELIIGNNVHISKNVVFYTQPFNYDYLFQGEYIKAFKKGKIEIGNNVMIYPFCFIQGNVKIGDNVVIREFSTITEDIPSNSIFINGKIIKHYENKIIIQEK